MNCMLAIISSSKMQQRSGQSLDCTVWCRSCRKWTPSLHLGMSQVHDYMPPALQHPGLSQKTRGRLQSTHKPRPHCHTTSYSKRGRCMRLSFCKSSSICAQYVEVWCLPRRQAARAVYGGWADQSWSVRGSSKSVSFCTTALNRVCSKSNYINDFASLIACCRDKLLAHWPLGTRSKQVGRLHSVSALLEVREPEPVQVCAAAAAAAELQ